VQACGSIAKVVLHIDNNAISDVGGDVRNWPLAIDAHDRTCVQTIRVGRDPGHVEIIYDRGSMGEHAKAQEWDDAWEDHVVLWERMCAQGLCCRSYTNPAFGYRRPVLISHHQTSI